MNEKIISSRLKEVCKIHKDKIAVKTDATSLSYTQLDVLSDELAKYINTNEVQSKIVATLLAPGLEYILSIIGINKSGKAFLPIDISHPLSKIEEQISFSKPAIIIVSKQSEHLIEKEHENVMFFLVELIDSSIHISKKVDGVWTKLQKPKAGELTIKIDRKSNAYVLYTSGSTGKPKAIVGRNDSLCHFIEWQIEEFKLDGIKGGLLTNLGFDVSLRDIFTPLLSGGELIIPARSIKEDVFYILDWIKREKIELLHVVPSVLRIFIQQDAIYFASLKFIFTAGEALFWKDVYQWREKINNIAVLINLYGPSETTLAKLFHVVTDYKGSLQGNQEQVVPLGKSLPDTQVFIYNDNHVCEEGETGEILISSSYKSNGYLFNEELNAEKFGFIQIERKEVAVYATGDLGFLKNGEIHFAGRKDRQVKISGNRVELLEVEIALAGFDDIDSCAVLTNEITDNLMLIAFYTAKSELQKEAIVAYLKNFLPDYTIPGSIFYIDEIPLNANGKKNYRKLLEIYNEKNVQVIDSISNQTELKTKVFSIIKKNTSVTSIRDEDTFLELGISSLKSIQILSNLYKEFKVKIPLVFMLKNNVTAIVDFINDNLAGLNVLSEVNKPINESFQVSPNQKLMLVATMYSKESNLAYNVLLAYRIKGDLDEQKIKNFVHHLIQTYEIFRTTYIYSNNSFLQKIHPKSEKFNVYEKIVLNESEISNHLKDELNIEFDLFNDSVPLKVSLLEIGPDNFVLVFKTHHVTVDIQALENIKNDFLTYYHTGELKAFNPIYEYTHFTKNYNDLLHSPAVSKAKDFWMSKFMNKTSFELPSDFKRLDERDFVGGNIDLVLNESLSKKIIDFTKHNNASLFMFYTSALSLFFQNYSKSNEIIFGMPMTLRDLGETYNDTIGFFVNTLPVKFIVDENQLFKDHLQDKSKELFEYYENKFYPFPQIVEDINYRHELNRNPIFNYMVVGIESETFSETDNGFNFKIEPLGSNDYTTKFDLTFMVIRHDDTISLKMEYDAKLYKEATAVFFLEQIKNVLNQVIDNNSILIKDIKFDYREFAQPVLKSSESTENEKVKDKSAIISSMNSIEMMLYLIWKETLGHGEIEVTEDFFEAGGTSMKAINIVTRINTEFKTKHTLVDLYLNPTIKLFAELLNRKASSNNDYQISLEKEAVFSKKYDLQVGEFIASGPVNILLTGATGYVGCYLTESLLKYDIGKLYCLVRCHSEEEGFARLKKNMLSKGLWQDRFEKHIVIVKGDVSHAKLGIESHIYEELSSEVNLVLHNATYMSHLLNYEVLKRANVSGMEEIFQFCLNKKMKKLHYISTTSVFNAFTFNKDIVVDESSSIDNEKHYNHVGYKATKWVAEKMAEKAAVQFGIPIVNHRLGLVLWDSTNKMYDGTNQWLKQFIESCGILGSYPDYDAIKYLTINIDVLVDNICSFINKDYKSDKGKYTTLNHFTKLKSPKDLVVDYYGEGIGKMTCIDAEEWLTTAKKKELPISWKLLDLDEDELAKLGPDERVILNDKTFELLNEVLS